MKKNKARKKRKSDHQVLEELFPKEVVAEIDTTLAELNGSSTRLNPAKGRPLKPWGRKWSEARKKLKSE